MGEHSCPLSNEVDHLSRAGACQLPIVKGLTVCLGMRVRSGAGSKGVAPIVAPQLEAWRAPQLDVDGRGTGKQPCRRTKPTTHDWQGGRSLRVRAAERPRLLVRTRCVGTGQCSQGHFNENIGISYVICVCL